MRARYLGMAVLSAVVLAHTAEAQDAEGARRAAIVVKLGPKNVTVGELEDRMAQVPAFQLRSFGATPDEVRRKFLDQVVIPDALLAQGAEARHLDRAIPTLYDLDRARAQATLRAVRARVGLATAISLDDVRAYYDANRPRYDAAERYNVWRILCATQGEAQSVLGDAKKDSTLAHWNQLSRDHSIDKATYMRGGNLGFVSLDGVSSEAGLKVEPVLVKAAAAVKDGEFVAEPVAEGSAFAVIWRRGTVGASHRTVEDVKEQIQSTLWRDRVDAATKTLLDALKQKDLKEKNAELLDGIDVTPPDGNVVPRKRPGQVAPVGSGK